MTQATRCDTRRVYIISVTPSSLIAPGKPIHFARLHCQVIKSWREKVVNLSYPSVVIAIVSDIPKPRAST